ncbi:MULTISPECIES: cupin domain-containing protein [unclassified Paraburkholderia]|uniref:cupin domain-containing protein n=1 Tax=unclassified Paraburkholderia TaxID=2615204 RepID=UPI00161A7252|nr:MULTISPECIES: cupin domain-containing protein [unclassified Paraburkholderia]MBB5448087.1 putative RmlC-like cupin family protein [Paraburkholderia sp. WSM4177]MBB5488533.1 putative RmlC-like cupin family protein [Paraburkholderia sp. WSM4180]
MSNVTHDARAPVVKVRPEREMATMQRLPYFVGISAGTAGTTGLSMYMVVVPPGGHAEPHFHADYETAIYMLEGKIETRYGPGLRESVITEPGDFLFIPPGVPHQPFNLDANAAARAIVARNHADEHERVVPYDPSEDA